MAYGTSLGITLPTVGATAGPTWATNLNTAITSIITVLETKVTPSGMDINADLSFRSGSTSYSATDVKAVEFTNQSSALAAATYPTTLFTTDSDGELYYNDNAGRQVQVTSNGSVNVSTSGGITGSGYGASSVEVNWDSGTTTYKMRSGAAADDYASVFVNDLKLNDGSGNTLTLAAPSMSADYTLTLPSAVAGANGTLLQMSIAGTVTADSTGLDSVTLAAGEHFTVSAAGQYKHGSRTIVIPGSAFLMPNPPTDAIIVDTADTGYISIDSATDRTLIAPIPLPAGKRITAITWTLAHGANASNRTYAIRKVTLATQSGADQTSNTDGTSGGAAFQITTGSLTITLAAGAAYFLSATLIHTGDKVYGAEITYDE